MIKQLENYEVDEVMNIWLKTNIAAVNFYKHCGFVIKAKQPNEDSGYMEYAISWTK